MNGSVYEEIFVIRYVYEVAFCACKMDCEFCALFEAIYYMIFAIA